MSSTMLEQIRTAHEDIENYERVIVDILNEKPRNHRNRVLHGHKVSGLLDTVTKRSKDAIELYTDKDNILYEEMQTMRGRSVFSNFYDNLKKIRDFHRKYPNVSSYVEPDITNLLKPKVNFSGEERYGKYIDLNEFYTQFLNIPAFKQTINKFMEKTEKLDNQKNINDYEINLSYTDYLLLFSDFSNVPKKIIEDNNNNTNKNFYLYINDLLNYLRDFYRRTQPLVDLDEMLQEVEKNYNKNKIDNNKMNENNKLYCKICMKVFTSENIFNSHLNGKKHKKNIEKSKNNDNNNNNNNIKDDNGLIILKIVKMNELLTEVIDGTRNYLIIKQTRTFEEIRKDLDDEENNNNNEIDYSKNNMNDDDEEEEDDIIYNPLNLPLGWDGKPIPYWLYKLHGLGVEYKCEICGNYSYYGRKNFDLHFQEWRHAHGMRCLQIPNTKHFHDITSIQDAIQLYDKLKGQIEKEKWKAGEEEEYEDSEGNVLNKKTYDDLARQGLL